MGKKKVQHGRWAQPQLEALEAEPEKYHAELDQIRRTFNAAYAAAEAALMTILWRENRSDLKAVSPEFESLNVEPVLSALRKYRSHSVSCAGSGDIGPRKSRYEVEHDSWDNEAKATLRECPTRSITKLITATINSTSTKARRSIVRKYLLVNEERLRHAAHASPIT